MFADLAIVHIHIWKHKGFVVLYLTGLCATLYGIAQVPSQQTCKKMMLNNDRTCTVSPELLNKVFSTKSDKVTKI